MSNGATSQNELVASSDDPAAGGNSSSPAPTAAPTAEAVDVEAGTKGVPVIFPAPVYISRTGHAYELPADTIKAVDDFPVPDGFRRERTREASFRYSIGVYVEPVDENTKNLFNKLQSI